MPINEERISANHTTIDSALGKGPKTLANRLFANVQQQHNRSRCKGVVVICAPPPRRSYRFLRDLPLLLKPCCVFNGETNRLAYKTKLPPQTLQINGKAKVQLNQITHGMFFSRGSGPPVSRGQVSPSGGGARCFSSPPPDKKPNVSARVGACDVGEAFFQFLFFLYHLF